MPMRWFGLTLMSFYTLELVMAVFETLLETKHFHLNSQSQETMYHF